mgnify:CR=1 FL=1
MNRENLVGMSIKSFKFISKLGKGTYGCVYQAFDEKSNKNVAIKAISLD